LRISIGSPLAVADGLKRPLEPFPEATRPRAQLEKSRHFAARIIGIASPGESA
jgi:hypothetical protein